MAEEERETVRNGPPPPPPRSSRGRMLEPQLLAQPGDLIAGKYRVEGLLGAGGVGVVVAATHQKLGERVAIKLLQRSAMKDGDTVARFAREARAAVRIKSPHVARVIDVGELEDGVPYMVMEHLTGGDLGRLLKERKRIPIPEAVDYVLQACEAVAEAHALGIVHRDLKPANLFLTRRPDATPEIKVLDFGISKITSRDGSFPDEASMTQTATVIGSPLYMSPEQMESARDTDHRTDIWSLGTILYELISGVAPFEAATMPQLCARILNGEPTPLLTLVPDAPEGLWPVLARCLRKSPNERYAHIGELALALLPFAPRGAKVIVERIIRTLESAGLTQESMPFDLDRDSRVGTTVRPLAETRHESQAPSKRIMISIAAIGIAIGALVVMAQAAPASATIARRSMGMVELVAERVARESSVPVDGDDAPPVVEPAHTEPEPTAEPSHAQATEPPPVAAGAAWKVHPPETPPPKAPPPPPKAPPPPPKAAPVPTTNVLDER